MKKLFKILLNLLPSQKYQSDLEQYIINHQPTSVAEVEHLTNAYSRTTQQYMYYGVTGGLCQPK